MPGPASVNVFTICASNYLAMARTLAVSVRAHHPDARTFLVLCDHLPDWVDASREPFEAIVTLEELPLPDREAWTFQHEIAELCTAAKGIAFRHLFERFGLDHLVYLDPDTMLFSPLDAVTQGLSEADVLLTPHYLRPLPAERAAEELQTAAQGVYNLGFLALKQGAEARRFLDWWADRCYRFSYYSSAEGLFYDQAFVSNAPALFDRVKVLRDPCYNAAFWNMRERGMTRDADGRFLVDGRPLAFFHFSHLGYSQEEIFGYMPLYSPAVLDLTRFYLAELEKADRRRLQAVEWAYARYDDGVRITAHQRLVYRREGFAARFPQPFRAGPAGRSYRAWYRRRYTAFVLSSRALDALKDATRPLRKRLRRAPAGDRSSHG